MLLAQRFALAVNGILAQMNGDDFYALGGNTPPEEWRGLVRAGLSKWWGVEDADSCREPLRWLTEEGHSAELEQALAPGVSGGEPPSPEAVRMAREVGGRALIAWDAARVVNVAGWGFVAGYLEEVEAWQHAVNAAAIVQRVYDSWAELGRHYVLGKKYWNDSDDGTEEALEALVSMPESPWRCIPWRTELALPGVPVRLGPYWSRVAMRFAARPAPEGRPLPIAARSYPTPARLVRSADGADLVAEGGKETWRDAHDLGIARDQVQDDWGPLRRDLSRLAGVVETLEEWTRHDLSFRSTAERDGAAAAERTALGFGYSSVGHLFRVRATVLKHYGTPQGALLSESALDSSDCHAAAVKVSAELGLPPPPPSPQDEEEDEEGGDDAGLGAAFAAMAGTFGAGQERAGAMAAQLMNAMFGGANAAPAALSEPRDDEPVPFEKYCEMTAAMTAWGQTGANAMIEFPRAFGVDLMAFQGIASYWATRMSGDPQLGMRYVTLFQQFTSKYQAPR